MKRHVCMVNKRTCTMKFKERANRESAHVADEENVNFNSESNRETNEEVEENALLSSNETVLMQTAQTKIKYPFGMKEKEVRILFDSGAQRTYISEHLAKSPGLQRGKEEEIRLVTFGCDKTKVIKTVPTRFIMKLNCGEEIRLSANIVPNITGTIQRRSVSLLDKKRFEELSKNLVLADNIPKERESDKVDLLIGNDYYLDSVTGDKIEVQPALYRLSSKLGWILTGRTHEVEGHSNDINIIVMTHRKKYISKKEVFTKVDDELIRKPNLEDFSNLESIRIIYKVDISDDQITMNSFEET